MEELSFAEIISYATIAEDNAIRFYQEAAARAQRPEVRSFLEELARMEEGHKHHLQGLLHRFQKSGSIPRLNHRIQTLGYAEFVKPATLDAEASYREVLEAAMAKEREAVATYEKLGLYVEDPDARQVFAILTEEEKKHLAHFEKEYDDLSNQNW
jgi:rubrerythrin